MSDMKPIFPTSPEEQPVLSAWRPALSKVVVALVAGNYALEPGIPGVAPISASTASQISSYLASYGATLVALPEDSWESSVCIWGGYYWEILVDLYTEEEGRSDLVMHAQVDPSGIMSIYAVYVP